MIYQSESAECGLACIGIVAGLHGRKFDMQTLRSYYSVSLTGSNLQQLMALGEEFGLSARALKLEMEDIPKLALPCILHWNMKHFVVLKKVRKKSITILDPARGECKISMDEVSKSFTGIALELTPTSDFKKQDERVRLNLNSFWTNVSGLISSLTKLFILSLTLQILMLAAPYYTQTVVDEVLVSYDKPLLVVLALGFGLLVLIRVATNALRGWVVLHLGAVMSVQMGANLFRHLIHLPLNYFEKRHIGDVVSRFASLNQVRELFTNNLVESIIDGLMAIIVLIVMFLYSPVLAFVVIGMTVIYALSRILLYTPLKNRNEAAIMAEATEQSNFMETVRGMQSIKLFGHQIPRLNLWQNRYADTVNENYRLGQWQVSYQTINQLLFGMENVVVVYLAAMFVMGGDLTVGMLFAFLAYKGQFTERMVGLIDRLVEVKMVRLHLDRLADIALTEKEDEGVGAEHREINGALKLNKVCFRYAENDPLLFHELDLTIYPGESIAIIGPSGNGKTTLLKIMLGLLAPSSGKVEVDDVDITHIGLRNYRQQVAAVMQNDQLMSGSIAENISFFDASLDMEKVIRCAKTAAIHKDISAMQMGYNALIGDMGSTLSGGQKQRLLLARALYRSPKILFMDEATSHLDVPLERLVNQAIKQLNMTRVLIAHRPETISNADKVYRLEGGQLREVKTTDGGHIKRSG